MHESEKRKWSRSVKSDSQQPHGLQPSRLLHPWDFIDFCYSVGINSHQGKEVTGTNSTVNVNIITVPFTPPNSLVYLLPCWWCQLWHWLINVNLLIIFTSSGGICVSSMIPGGSDHKESACNVGDLGSIPGLGRSLREGNGNPLQHSCLENPKDEGAWWATVRGLTKSWTGLTLTLFHYNLPALGICSFFN